MINYVTGDATYPIGDGEKIICHIVNDIGRWGRGFVLAVSKRWDDPEKLYRAWSAAAEFELGAVQFVGVDANLWVANMVAQHGVDWIDGGPPIRYDALTTALNKVGEFARSREASVHMPRIGCHLAGGNWQTVGPIVDIALSGVNVTVYDLP